MWAFGTWFCVVAHPQHPWACSACHRAIWLCNHPRDYLKTLIPYDCCANCWITTVGREQRQENGSIILLVQIQCVLRFFLFPVGWIEPCRTQEYKELMAPFKTNGVASLGEAYTWSLHTVPTASSPLIYGHFTCISRWLLVSSGLL